MLLWGVYWIEALVRIAPHNRAYAAQAFDGVEIGRVLASRRLVVVAHDHHPWDLCRYAVIELALPVVPDPAALTAFNSRNRISDWQPTTGRLDRGETSLDHWCAPNFSEGLFQRMKVAMEDEGS